MRRRGGGTGGREGRWGAGGRLALVLGLIVLVVSTGCDDDDYIVVDGGEGAYPAAPRNVDAYYHDRAVYVTWELGPGWDDDAFRIYSKRTTDADYFLIAEVTNCAGGLCSYADVNVQAGRRYEYYVASVHPASGRETASDYAIEVVVPQPDPPPVPGGTGAVALDGTIYLQWNEASRNAEDFSFYRVYLAGGDGTDYLLGETDSQGFLDELAENGLTYTYFVTAVDDQGHESGGSVTASGTPRPDFHGDWLWEYGARPQDSGFRFQSSEETDPVMDGDDAGRHFRLEADADGWWLVPGPGTAVYPQGFVTTALRCGPGADAGCADVAVAPTSGYVTSDVGLATQTTYILRVGGDDGLPHYAAVRVELLGYDQAGDGIMIFDWSYQLQAENPELAPGGPGGG